MIKNSVLFLVIFFCTFTFGLEFPVFAVSCSSDEPKNNCTIRQLTAEIKEMKKTLVKENADLKKEIENSSAKLEKEFSSLKETVSGLQKLVKLQRTHLDKNDIKISRLQRQIQTLSKLSHSHNKQIMGDLKSTSDRAPSSEDGSSSESDSQPESSGVH